MYERAFIPFSIAAALAHLLPVWLVIEQLLPGAFLPFALGFSFPAQCKWNFLEAL